MNKLLALVLMLPISFTAGCASIAQSVERASLFHPKKELLANPRSFGLEAQDVFILSGENRIHGWFFPGEPDRMYVVYLHGNAENISSALGLVASLRPQRLNVLLIDYRGYGKSQGEPSVEGIVEDATAAVDWVMERQPPQGKIALWGRSLGVAAALGAAQNRPNITGVVLESGFTSLRSIARHHAPYILSFLVRDKLDNLAAVSTLAMPKLIIHGGKDEVIPFSHGEELYEKALGPKDFYPIPQAGHNDLQIRGAGEYLGRITSWLNSL